jgi:hypothetical protein
MARLSENIKINNRRCKMEIFYKLMAVPINQQDSHNYWEELEKLEEFKEQGKIRIYRPEQKDHGND